MSLLQHSSVQISQTRWKMSITKYAAVWKMAHTGAGSFPLCVTVTLADALLKLGWFTADLQQPGLSSKLRTAADCLYFDVTTYILLFQYKKFKANSCCRSMKVHWQIHWCQLDIKNALEPLQASAVLSMGVIIRKEHWTLLHVLIHILSLFLVILCSINYFIHMFSSV